MENTMHMDPAAPFIAALEHNLTTKKCSFDPLAHVEESVEDGIVTLVLPLGAKVSWFNAYCAENNLQGSIESDDYSISDFRSQNKGMVNAKARVLIDDRMVASAIASAPFDMSNADKSLNDCLQTASGSALSRALSFAGFGTISVFKYPLEDPSGDTENADMDATVNKQSDATSHAVTSAPQANMPPVNTAAAPAADPIQPPPAAPVKEATRSGRGGSRKQTQIEAAEAIIWKNGRAPYNGMTLGELARKYPNYLEFIALKWNLGAKPENQHIVEAAKLLLDQAREAAGK